METIQARNERNTLYGQKVTFPAIPADPKGRPAVDPVIVQWKLDESSMIAAPIAVGVQLGIVYPVGKQGQDVRIRARVTWGDGQARFSALMDFLDGTSFSLNATYVEIEAVNASAFGTPDPAVNVTAWALITPRGSISNRRRAQLTIPGIGVSPDFGVNIPITAFAHAATVVRTPTAGTFHLQYRDYADNVIGESASIAAGADVPEFAIPGNTANVQIKQDGGTTSAELIWILDL